MEDNLIKQSFRILARILKEIFMIIARILFAPPQMIIVIVVCLWMLSLLFLAWVNNDTDMANKLIAEWNDMWDNITGSFAIGV